MRILSAVLLASVALLMTPAAPAFAKDKPGHCGTMKYFDKKAKKCASASSEKKKKDDKGKKSKKAKKSKKK